MRTVSLRLSATFLMQVLLTGCASVPPPHPTAVAPPGVTLPIPATVLFEVPPSQRNYNVSSFGPYVWSYQEAPLMRASALDVLRQMFSEVIAAEGLNENGLVLQVSGYTSINPGVSQYYATAVADVFVRSDVGERQVARYRGTGSAWGAIYSYLPLQAAYAQAFTELSRQMLADPILMKRVTAQGNE